MEISSSMFIHENVLVDPFMADLKAVIILEPIRYLLRAPFLADQPFDQTQVKASMRYLAFLRLSKAN